MSENNNQVSEASRNKERNTGADSTQAGSGNTTTRPGYEEQPTLFGKWPWGAQLVLILSIIACIVVLLIGLPIGSLMIVDNMSSDSLSPTMSFWGALFAAFISLTTLFIGATFAFTAFKVQTGAIWEARKAVEEEVDKNFEKILRCRAEYFLANKGDDLVKEVAGGFLENKGDDLVKEVAGGFLENKGDDLVKEVAGGFLENKGDDLVERVAGKFLKNKGDDLVIGEADRYLKKYGAGLTKEAAGAYVEAHGEEITGKVIEKCAARNTGLRGWLRGIFNSKDASASSSEYTKTGEKQTSGDASSDAPSDAPNNTDSRS